MKKILCILVFILAVACVLSACNQSPSPSVETTSTTPEETTPESTTPEETTPEEKTKHLWSDWITIKDAKCEEKGLLQRYCTECYYTESKPIDVLGHTEVIDAAVAPTCTQVGFSEGKHCSVCNKVFIAQQSIDALGHTEVIDAAVAPTCTQVGFSEGKHCSACGEILIAQKIIPENGHTEVVDKKTEPTCTEIGFTEGKHCSACGKILIAQEIIPENGHNYAATFVAPTAKEDGATKHTCSNCGDFYFTDVITPIDFTVTEGNRFMVGYTGEQGENLVIPAVFQEDGIWYRVTSIGNSAFDSCTSLTSITIPDSVTSIGYRAFYYCTSLTSILVDNDNTAYQSINGNLYSKGGKTLIAYAIGKTDKSFTIPDSVTSIGYGAFEYCSSLRSVTITDSVTSIGHYAFRYCTSLTSVTIPDSVTSIGASAFYKCTSLTSVTIPDSVTSIGYGAFVGCNALTSLIVESENPVYYSEGNCIITRNEKVLIQGCNNSVISQGIMSIGDYAFQGCDSLTSITIPDSVTSIGDGAFYGCTSLTSILVDNDNTAYQSIDGNLYSKGGKTLIAYAIGKTDKSFTIPDSVTSIGYRAFYYCTSLTSVTIGDSVTSIGEHAFYSCFSLTSVTIPNSVKSIGYEAFNNCDSLTSVTIGDSVTSIGYGAFYGCTSLTSVTFVNPNGWWRTQGANATSGRDITAESLADPATAAQYLRSNYLYYYWFRTE